MALNHGAVDGQDRVWRQLQETYRGMGDQELLALLRNYSGLTETAQQVLTAEVDKRGLELPPEEVIEQPSASLGLAEADSGLVKLMTFSIATDARTAAAELEKREIPFELKPNRGQATPDSPWAYTGWIDVFIEPERKAEAVVALRQSMGLFPVSEVDSSASDVPTGGEELFPLGEFASGADSSAARQALTQAGIWFRAESGPSEEIPGAVVTHIEVRFEDMERAFEVVDDAFPEE